MNDRIRKLAQRTVAGKMYVEPIKTEYDREDVFLSTVKRNGKRVCEYILNQEPLILKESCFTGFLNFDGSVIGDLFSRIGHTNFCDLGAFYMKPIHNLYSFEWQHSVGDFGKIIRRGLIGIQEDIASSMKVHADDSEKIEFLETQRDFCHTVTAFAHKCAEKTEEFAAGVAEEEYKKNLLQLAQGLKNVPEKPAENFFEAVLSLYVCYSYIPDSVGLLDRYLYPYYKADIESGKLTRERAAEYLQELFLMIQARTRIESDRFYRGGESHFCIGGYLENGEDGFNELSRLILDSLMELPTWIPQISLRHTAKTPHEVFRYVMDCERRDPNKRIAFVSDEPRIKGFMKYGALSYVEAVNYSMCGCNEPALPGGTVIGLDKVNAAHSLQNIFFDCREELLKADTFERFYEIYERELFSDLYKAEAFAEKVQRVRERDCNIVSNIFFDGCIENARSCSQRGVSKYSASAMLIGITTVVDSLTVVKQFVYDEKTVSMRELIDALHADWAGCEELHKKIAENARYFGNDDDLSNEMAKRFLASIDKWDNHENYIGKKYLIGNIIGYNEYHKIFGDGTPATPDGRHAGERISFGIGQSGGRDRNGITALLNSVAQCNELCIMCGSGVTNVLLEESLVRDDESFEKLTMLFETYFELGGMQFQLMYVSKDDLIAAQKDPDAYKSLRVRVSGFSDYFVNLNRAIQDEIIARTEQAG